MKLRNINKRLVCFALGAIALVGVFISPHVCLASASFNYFRSQIDITPSTTGGWQTVDVSAYVPSGATGVFLLFSNPGGVNFDYGVRHPSSTDNFFTNGGKNNKQGYIMSGVDSNRQFQIYMESGSQVNTYLLGYTMSGVTFLTNRVDKTPGTTGDWVNVSLSPEAPSETIGALFIVQNESPTTAYNWGLRKWLSTDNRLGQLRNGGDINLGIIGTDTVLEIPYVEANLQNSAVKLYLIGYVTAGARFFTTGVNKSTATLGQYEDVDITDDLVGGETANGAIVEMQLTSGAYGSALRPNDAVYDFYDDNADTSKTFALVGTDCEDIFEQKIESSNSNLFLIGYSLADTEESSFEYRRKITINELSGSCDTESENLSSFPALINLSDTWLNIRENGGNIYHPRGYDIIFKDSGGINQLPHEIEYYGPTPVQQIDSSWGTGLGPYTVPAGTNRLLVFVTGFDDSKNSNILQVDYGSATMHLAATAENIAGGNKALIAIYYLTESEIPGGSNNFVVWYDNMPTDRLHAYATLEKVDQTNPVVNTASNGNDIDPITAMVNVVTGGKSVAAAMSTEPGTYAWSWMETTDQNGTDWSMSTAVNAASANGTRTASADHSSNDPDQALAVASFRPAASTSKLVEPIAEVRSLKPLERLRGALNLMVRMTS